MRPMRAQLAFLIATLILSPSARAAEADPAVLFGLEKAEPSTLVAVVPSETSTLAPAPTEAAVVAPAPATTPSPAPTPVPVPVAAPTTAWEKVTNQVKTWLGDKPKSASSVTAPKSPSSSAPAQVAKPSPLAPVPAPVVSGPSVEELRQQLPNVKPEAQQSTRDQMVQTRDALKSRGFGVSKAGRAPSKDLKLNKIGVPLVPTTLAKKVKDKTGKVKVVQVPMTRIPLVDIGEEPSISKSDFTLPEFNFSLPNLPKAVALKSPESISDLEVTKLTSKAPAPAAVAKQATKNLIDMGKPVTRESVAAIRYQINKDEPVQKLKFKEFSEEELQMLAALILASKTERCFMTLGLFDRLSTSKKVANEANFQLGLCADKMQLVSTVFERLAPLVKLEDKEFLTEAISVLSRNVPQHFEIEFSRLIRQLKNSSAIAATELSRVSYLVAKGAYREGLYPVARKWAERVDAKAPEYGNAQYIIGVSHYNEGSAKKAVAKLEEIRAWMQKGQIQDKNLNSLTAVNLARMYFATNKYQQALDHYMAIDRDHPVWVQALIEQGWLQLSMEDHPGAIGNMYSLHSPYFRSVYKPESFAIRTIGYLGICQYGDAYRSLSWLEEEYRPWFAALGTYMDAKSDNEAAYFETVKNYLKGKSDTEVDGVPAPVLREAARQRDYLNNQVSLNGIEDEFVRYDGVNSSIKEEKAKIRSRMTRAKERYDSARKQIAKAEKDKTNRDQIADWKRQAKLDYELSVGLRFQLQMLEISRQNYIKFRTESMKLVDSTKSEVKLAAGKSLKKHLGRLRSEMERVLNNNEFLRYEVFSGSGENIRYQVAGGEAGETANRIPASVKPQKQMNWTFDGEYWADEIGKYRSSLKNNCGTTVGKMDEYFKNKAVEKTALKEGDVQ